MQHDQDLNLSFQNPSEERAFNAVKATFGHQFQDHVILTNVILPTAEVGGPRTSEYDLIFICSAGVIVFEVKGWANGRLTSKKGIGGQHEWTLEKPSGERVPVRDPISQGGFKVRYLLESLGGVFCTQYALFTEPDLVLDQSCNAHAIQIGDLPYLSRMTRSTAKKYHEPSLLSPEKIRAIASALSEISQPFTQEQHMTNVLDWARQKDSEREVLTAAAKNSASPTPSVEDQGAST